VANARASAEMKSFLRGLPYDDVWSIGRTFIAASGRSRRLVLVEDGAVKTIARLRYMAPASTSGFGAG
jgi:hypothetical protein